MWGGGGADGGVGGLQNRRGRGTLQALPQFKKKWGEGRVLAIFKSKDGGGCKKLYPVLIEGV